MEEVLAIVFQLFFELLFNVLASGMIDLAARNTSAKTQEGCGVFLLHAGVGGGLGFLSTLAVPKLILPLAWMRMLNLLAGPLVAGASSAVLMAWVRPKTAASWGPFVHGFLFALMFGLARFAFGQH